ncbi:solute carrier family 49 member 4 homolog [Oscarella lobularis]|uniref:solute carrier family 49 member 4 homolog n=1 Tax=Oscarella lobularis TaxID=121494 RepID=UPI0033142A92
MNDIAKQKDPLIDGKDDDEDVEIPTEETKVYYRRFYVVFAVFLLAFTQSWIWNGWGPIQGPAEAVFGWSDSVIALMANWGPISYVISIVFWTWLMGKNLRHALLLTAFLTAAGAGLRCCSMDPIPATWLNHFGLFLNGLAGPVAMSAPPLVSAYWFPPKQRTTATALTSLAGYYGVSLSFVIGPLLVPDRNQTNSSLLRWKDCNLTLQNFTDCQTQHWRHGIFIYQLTECAAAGLAFLLILIYLPSKPPKPPSITAGIQRTSYFKGLKQVLGHKQFWLVCLSYGISTGVFAGWFSVLDVNLKHFSVQETEAGWIGFYSNIAGAVAGLVISWLADVIGRRTKSILLIILVGATLSFTWFTLLCLDVLPKSTISLYFAATLGGLLLNGSIPLFYELAVEATYPIAEGTTTGLLTLMNNVSCMIFLFLPLIKVLAKDVRYWMNPVIAGSCFLCIPLMILFKARYRRLSVDLSPTAEKGIIQE